MVLLAVMQKERNSTIFISAAEASADSHAAALIRQLSKELPQFTCVGLGGSAMSAAGCNLLENLVDTSAMLTHALTQVGFYYRLLRRLKRYFRQNRPELVVVMDSPAWNFHVAKAAKALDIPILYYIVPQMWAWGAWRIGKLRRCTDRLACILPFEQQWFNDRGLNAEFVGHPLFDDANTENVKLNKPPALSAGAKRNRPYPTIALLPGSRSHELDHLWPAMQDIAVRIKNQYSSAHFVTTAFNDNYEQKLRFGIVQNLDIEISKLGVGHVTSAADLAIVASGTATLEVAGRSCPMVVMYYVNPVLWHLLGRWLIKSEHISLVNILADKELVPEFVPFYGQISQVTDKVLELLGGGGSQLKQMRKSLNEQVLPITNGGAASNVVGIIKDMLGC